MAGAVGEAHDLVLDRGAIAGAAPGDGAVVDGGFLHVGGDDGVGGLGRVGDAASDLGNGDAVRQKGERHRLVVGGLHVEARPVDGRAAQARGRSRLETAQWQAGGAQAIGQAERGGLAVTAGGNARLADVDHAAEEGAGREDNRIRRQLAPVRADNAADLAVPHDKVLHRARDDGEARGRGNEFLHGGAVKVAVALGAGAAHGRALGAVEQAELNAGGVGCQPHQPAHRVDFADKVALAEAADRRVAAHLADGGRRVGDERSRRAQACGGRGRLDARMAAADHDDCIVAHARHIESDAPAG